MHEGGGGGMWVAMIIAEHGRRTGQCPWRVVGVGRVGLLPQQYGQFSREAGGPVQRRCREQQGDPKAESEQFVDQDSSGGGGTSGSRRRPLFAGGSGGKGQRHHDGGTARRGDIRQGAGRTATAISASVVAGRWCIHRAHARGWDARPSVVVVFAGSASRSSLEWL